MTAREFVVAPFTTVHGTLCLLQILEGSHKCGRIDHGLVAGQTGADEARVELIKDALPLKYVEMQPGEPCHVTSPEIVVL